MFNPDAITIKAERVSARPDMQNDTWGKDARHWLITLQYAGHGGNLMTFFFSQGSAHKKVPTVKDIMYCLASDAMSIRDAQDFEDWANEYGYDADSRKAEGIYRMCQKQVREMRQLFGRDYADVISHDWDD